MPRLPAIVVGAIWACGCGAPHQMPCDRLATTVTDLGFEVQSRGVGSNECSLTGSTPTAGAYLRGDPVEVIRAWFISNGWKEDLTQSADGPGTTAFRFVQSDFSCQVAAGAPSYLEDDEMIVAETYALSAQCLRSADRF